MKKISFVLAIVMLSFLIGCESQQAEEIRLAKEKKEKIVLEREMLESCYRKYAILLALKYRVDEDKVFDLLAREDSPYDEGSWDEFERKIGERIKNYSEQYGIPIDIIASIYIDYEVMMMNQ